MKINLLLFQILLFVAVITNAQTPLSMNGRLKVSGKNLLNECNTAVQLRGLSTHGIMFEQDCYTESSIQSIAQTWKADVIRLAVYTNNSNGATKGYAQSTDQAFYHQWIDKMVTLTEKAGIYVIIDWHILTDGNPATYQTLAKSFFTLMSQKYKNKKHVLYEICNEPNSGTSWDQIKTYAADIIPAIRANDPNAVILVGTPEWSSRIDLARQSPLASSLSSNVMYSLHFYAGTSAHDTYKTYLTDAMAANFPVFVSEWGMTDASGAGSINATNTASWLSLLASNKVSWCNWQFSDKSETSSLLKAGACIAEQWTNFRTDGGGSGQIIYDELRKAKNYAACGSVTLPAIVTPPVCTGATGNLNIYGCAITNNFTTNYCEGYNNKQAYVKTDFSKDSVPYFTFWKKPSEGSTVYSSVVSNGKLVITSVNADPNYSTMGFNFGNLNATTLLPIDMRANAKLVFDVSFTKTNYAPADVALFIELIDAAGNSVNASALGAYNRFILPVDGSTKTITADFTNGLKRVANTTGTTSSPQEDSFTRGVFDFSKVTKITLWVNPGVTGVYARVPFTGTWTIDNFSFGYDPATAQTCDPYTTADLCPNDPNKTAPGKCGCGVPETGCDCAGIQNGTAYTDLCGICVGGTTGKQECAGNGYAGTPYPIPGKIESENFDKGGQGSAYNDLTATNDAGANYRPGEAVDIELAGGSTNNYDVGYTATGEWLNYTVNVLYTGTYNVSFNVASAAATGKWHLELNGQKIVNSDMVCPNTGGWQIYQLVKTTLPISLTQGKQVIRLVFDGPDVNVDYMLYETVAVQNTPPTVSLTAPSNNSSTCAGTAITLTASATDANGTVSKVDFFDGTILLGTVTSSPYTYSWSNAGTGTHNLTAKATDNGNATTTSSPISITVNTAPAAPGVTTPVTYCQNVTATALTATGTDLKWYTVPTNGTGTSTAPTPSTTTVGTTSYYVSQTTNGCESARATIAVTVNAIPSAPGVSTPVSYCQNATATALTATGTSLKWYTVPTSGTGTSTAPTPSTTTVGTTSYYVSQTVSGCESARTTIVVTVNAIPSTPTVSTPVTYCQNATATALTASGTSLLWYTVPTSGTSSSTAPTPSTTTVGTTSYYVSQTTSGCESARATIAVTVNAIPAAPGVGAAVTYCQNATATALTASGTSLLWYTVPASGTGSSTTPVPSTTATGTTSYYVSQTTSGCESSRAAIAVTVNAMPSAPTVSTPVTYCQNATAAVLSASGASLKWYSVPTSGTSSTTAPTPSTATTGTTSYYVSQTTNGCESARAMITVTINALPSATISAGGPTTFTQGGSVVLSANTGTGLTYRWLNGPAQVGTGSAYTATTGGDYSVEVTNASGCKTTSSVITVTVNGNLSPTVSITSPSNNTTFTSPASITITATANDADGTVSKVDFYNGSTFLGSDNSAPYSFIWTGVVSGTYSITAVATDNLGGSGTSGIISVIVNNQAPTISITAPSNNATFTAPASVTITATAGDADGTITKVDFYNGATLLGTDASSPYSFTWTSIAAGTYTITAVATDNDGANTTSSVVSITINPTPNQAPTVSITSPANNVTYTAFANVSITATATDADGSITKVEFYNGSTLLGTALSSPYSFAFNNLSAGTYTITAKATDNQGGVSTSAAINVIINPNQSSVITIISPINNSTVTGPSITINVNATDPDGSITKVEYLDGNTVIGTSTTQPYIFTWNNPTAGTHVLTVRVTDSNGGVTTSSPTSFTLGTGTGLISASYRAFTHVYPNPSMDVFTIKASQEIKDLSVVNMYGAEVITLQNILAEQQVEIGKDLLDGTYVLLIKYASDKMEIAKLVKIK